MTFRTCFMFLASCLVGCHALAAASTIQAHHSALWYDPGRDGEGFVLEVYDDAHALLTWYTYDDAGNQRWLTGLGSTVTNDAGEEHLHFPDMYAPRGGRFGPGFDPAQVERVPVGEITLRFDDCWHGQLDYAVFDQSGTIDLHRLTRTMGVNCAPIHGSTGEPIRQHAGQSGAWYDPAHDGEGWLLQWMAEGVAIVTWFTYTPAGEPYWMVGTGTLEGDTIVFPQMQSTRGARFGDAFDPADVERIDWGRLELTLNCDAGMMSYASSIAEFGSGDLDGLVHLTRLAGAACPAVKPAFPDLYAVSTESIILAPSDAPTREVFPLDVANTGVVLGSRSSQGHLLPALWRPGADQWESIPASDGLQALRISPDGSTVFAQNEDSRRLMRWRETDGWEELPGQVDVRDLVITGASRDRSQWLGRLLQSDGSQRQWRWAEHDGQSELPGTTLHPHAVFNAVSNDGSIVIGQSIPFVHNTFGPPDRIAGLLWREPARLNYLFDDQDRFLGRALTCNADCSIRFGVGQLFDPLAVEAWYETLSGRFGYLVEPGELPGDSRIHIHETVGDGSLVVGALQKDGHPDTAILWTQELGLVSLRQFMPVGQLESDQVHVDKVLVSEDASRLVMSGSIRRGADAQRVWATALHLQSTR